jgi:hypothetical protein
MSGVPLPRVSAAVLAEAVDGLPGRLRRKIDDMTARAAGWPVTENNGEYTIVVDEATTVTLSTDGGVVRTADAARCTCLLAPNCLHRTGVLACAPVDDAAEHETADVTEPQPAAPDDDGELTAPQLAAAESLWRAGAAVLDAGAGSSGVVVRTALLRAARDAQAVGVYRAAAAARRVASELQAWPAGQLTDLADAIRDLLAVTYQLRQRRVGARAGSLLGSARRRYEPRGSLRLYGLCSTAVLTGSGYAGVVSYLADGEGTVWTVADIAPGEARRAASAADASVKLGETGLTHRTLARAGLIVSGATASASRQLGAGASVRAVTGPGAGWHEEPLAGLWRQPLGEQVHRAFAALALPVTDRPAGDDLLFLAVRGEGTDGDALRVVTDDGTMLWLRAASDDPALAYRDNLHLLGQAPGLAMLVIGRPDRARRATVYPLAVSPRRTHGDAGPDTGRARPSPYDGHADLAFDRLHRGHLAGSPPGGRATTVGPVGGPVGGPPATDPALSLLRASTERAVAGGRAVMAVAPARGHLPDSRRLLQARLDTGSAVLAGLNAAAASRPRDVFGRLAADDEGAFARAWLAAAVYLDAADSVFAEASWTPARPPSA